MIKHIFISLIGAFAINSAYSATFTITEEGEAVGKSKSVRVKKADTLANIAKRNGITAAEIAKANPTLNATQRLAPGTTVVVPVTHRLPSGPKQGIVLNLADLRLYYFHPDGTTVSSYPVAVGRQGWSTPQGETTVVAKERNPAWRPPISIRREAARGGRTLPLVIPPGPRNPLGKYAMRLGFSGILIHGTIQPKSIGTRSSHGCIRMYSQDIQELFNLVPVGTGVRIVYEPKTKSVKAATATKENTQVSNPVTTQVTNSTGNQVTNPAANQVTNNETAQGNAPGNPQGHTAVQGNVPGNPQGHTPVPGNLSENTQGNAKVTINETVQSNPQGKMHENTQNQR